MHFCLTRRRSIIHYNMSTETKNHWTTNFMKKSIIGGFLGHGGLLV